MKIRYLGESIPLSLTNGHVYEVLSDDDGDLRIIDDTGEDYLYLLEKDEYEVVKEKAIA